MADVVHRVLYNRLTIPLTPFYRRFPRPRRGVSVNSADARGCVDLERGFFYNRIPKAANSTVVTTLARLTGEDLSSREAKRRCLTPSRLRRAEVQRIERLFCFTVVRNPFTRTLSAYLDKVERRAQRQGVKTSYAAFLDRLAGGALYDNAHWAPQSSLLLMPLEAFDFIGRVETLAEDLPYVLRVLGAQQSDGASVRSVTGNATDAASKLRKYYDAATEQLVRELFRDDFECFAYADRLPC